MIVVPMAGLSSRFTKSGYTTPKWQLPIKERPVFDWSMLSFEKYFQTERFIIVHLAKPDIEIFLRERIATLGIRDVQLIALNTPTRGQAETVVEALRLDHTDIEPITIFNIDTIRLEYRRPDFVGDGLIECVLADGDNWSFVKPMDGNPGRVAQVTEKIRISNYCSTGMYLFKNKAIFMKAYDHEVNHGRYSELYVAPLYQYLVDSGHDIRYSLIDADDVQFSGTPKEYESLVQTWQPRQYRC